MTTNFNNSRKSKRYLIYYMQNNNHYSKEIKIQSHESLSHDYINELVTHEYGKDIVIRNIIFLGDE